MSETWLTSLMSGALCALAADVYTLSDHGMLTEVGRQK